ncbi:MAG: hypothetical protein IT578_07525 [Verrucomicrobiae bacterium]|nr:hypothetical protein [Verrucomicrobiae bacterium]
MKVALAQFSPVPGDVKGNVARMTAFAADAARAGARAVLFPEMSDTGYAPSHFAAKAAAWDGAPFVALQDAARRHRLAVFAGLSEKDGTRIYNSLAAIGPDGTLLARYRKTHLFPLEPNSEPRHFTAGDALALFPFEGMTWGLGICYDLRFPEWSRALMLRGAEALVNVAAWPVARAAHWEIFACARAAENQTWFLGVNQVGVVEGIPQAGRSCVVNPRGEIVALASPDREELILAEISFEAVRDVRTALPVRASRRPGLYAELVRPDAEAKD